MPKRTSTPPLSQLHAVTAATAAGTHRLSQRWADTFVPDFYRRAHNGVTASSVAFGTYLGDSDDATDASYEQALRQALRGGINVIDTAINYRCQRSERVVGHVVQELMTDGAIRRDELVICTKAGYLPLDGNPPASRQDYERYVRTEFFEPGILRPSDLVGGGHSIAPAFLIDQLHRSMRNLGVQCIDYFYIHNPEQQLTAISPKELAIRMRAAFEAMEECVSRREIGAYGCATWNGLRLPAGSHGHLSLFELADIARQVAGESHHFRIAQLPINLTMSEAVRISTQRDHRGRLVHVTDAAAELGLDLVASAPLLQGQLTRDLPAQVRALFPGDTDAQRAIAFVRDVRGVLTAAVGMKDPAHVDENLRSLRTA